MTNYGFVLMEGDSFVAKDQDSDVWEYTDFLGEAMIFKTMQEALNFKEKVGLPDGHWLAVNLSILVEH